MSTAQDDNFFKLLEHPVENEGLIIETLSQRFNELQTKENRVYTLTILQQGSSVPVYINDDGVVKLQIPITRL